MVIDRLRAHSVDDHHRVRVHRRGDGNRTSFTAPANSDTVISSGGLYPAVTTPDSELTPRGSQIPIGLARRTVAATPARGFLPLRLIRRRPSQRTALSVPGRRLITLNKTGKFSLPSVSLVVGNHLPL
jgi:hypothetical protein